MQRIYEFYTMIGKNIKNIRKKFGDSQESLAEKLNMSRGFISQIESENINIGISLDTLFNICQLYNIDIKELFEGSEQFISDNNESK